MIRNALASDGSAIKLLLESCQLPTEDLSPTLLEDFLLLEQAGMLQGVVGLQIFAGVALLRSLAVQAGFRGQGWGQQLTRKAEDLARQRGIGHLYLLTTTAAGFFSKHGYQPVSRDQAPQAIQASAEFQSLCPASAVLMCKTLD